jgi:hypothetical protein
VDAPAVGLHELVLHRYPALEREQQGEGVSADLVAAVVGHVEAPDAALAQQLGVEVVEAHALPGDYAAVRAGGVEQLVGHLAAVDHERVRAAHVVGDRGSVEREAAVLANAEVEPDPLAVDAALERRATRVHAAAVDRPGRIGVRHAHRDQLPPPLVAWPAVAS